MKAPPEFSGEVAETLPHIAPGHSAHNRVRKGKCRLKIEPDSVDNIGMSEHLENSGDSVPLRLRAAGWPQAFSFATVLTVLAVGQSFTGATASTETFPGLTSLRPGWHGNSKPSAEVLASTAELISSFASDSETAPNPAGLELSTAALQLSPSNTRTTHSDQEARLEDAQRMLALAKTQHETATKASERAMQRLQEAETALEELSKPSPAPAQPTKIPGTNITLPPLGANSPMAPGENSIGMIFMPVGKVLFSAFETRVKDYAKFVEESDYPRTHWRNPGFAQTADDPVVMVSWNDAMSFCAWLTQKERNLGILGSTEYYRLPTDLEWSKAVGLPTESGKTPMERDGMFSDRFPWGIQWPPPSGAGNFSDTIYLTTSSENSTYDRFDWTAPVGSFKPNQYGLYDMSGNAWEWCLDTTTPRSKTHVLRGGSYHQGSHREALLSTCRLGAAADCEADSYGFRIVRTNDGGTLPK